MHKPFKNYVPQHASELYDMLAMMMGTSPTFKDEYFVDQTLDTVFTAFLMGLAASKEDLGAGLHRSLTDLAIRARALFESDPEDKTGESKEGQQLLWQMDEILEKHLKD
ncbi:MAG TPA: hypothetical protein VGE65_02880 [Sphingobium sp.]